MKKLIVLLMLCRCSTAFGAALDMAVTVTGAGDGSGVSGGVLEWDNAMSMAQFIVDVNGSAEAGDRYFVMEGTYSIPAATPINSSGQDGTGLAPIQIIGVKTGTIAEPPTSADWAYTTARPIIDGSTNTEETDWGDFYIFRNLYLQTDSSTGNATGVNLYAENCKFENTKNTTDGYEALSPGNYAKLVKCEVTGSASGTGMYITGGLYLDTCYFRDSAVGLRFSSALVSMVVNCIFDTCGTAGINILNTDNHILNGNVFHGCAIGINSVDGGAILAINNVFNECPIPIAWDAEQVSNYFNFNSYDGDEISNENITDGGDSINDDIDLNDPATGDFTVKNSSSEITNAGLKFDTNVGVTGTYKKNIGVDQDDNVASGGGGTVIGGGVVK